jgi:hypothetical protein
MKRNQLTGHRRDNLAAATSIPALRHIDLLLAPITIVDKTFFIFEHISGPVFFACMIFQDSPSAGVLGIKEVHRRPHMAGVWEVRPLDSCLLVGSFYEEA